MTLNDPLWQQNLSYSGTEDRTLAAAIFRGGVISAGDLKVTQRAAGTNPSVDIAAGVCAIPGTDAVGQGTYLCSNTAVVNLSIGAAPSAGNIRLDLVIAEVRDADVNAGANNDWQLRVVAGTPASTPTEPSLPVSAIPLALVTVASGTAAITNAMIANRRTFANAVSPATSTTLPLARTGQLAVATNNDIIYKGQSDGSWRDVLATGLGMAAISGALFGTPPSIAGTKFKVETFFNTTGAITGVGNVTIPSAFAGILWFGAIHHMGSTPMTLGYNPGGTISGTNLPVKIWEHGTPGWLNGAGDFTYTVVGW